MTIPLHYVQFITVVLYKSIENGLRFADTYWSLTFQFDRNNREIVALSIQRNTMTYYQAMKWEDPIYMLIQSSVKITFLQYLKPKVLKIFSF